MGAREDTLAILHYGKYENLPIVHFGYWTETIEKWHKEGHITDAEAVNVWDNSDNEGIISRRLGFDYNWNTLFSGNSGLYPAFEEKILEVLPNGQVKKVDSWGVIILEKPGVVSIPSEVGHLLEDRESWETHYKPKLQMNYDRISKEFLANFVSTKDRQIPTGIHCGSLYGNIRNMMGVEGTCYILADDEELFTEIIDTNAKMQLEVVEAVLKTGAIPDYGHFWEDICFKNGPLVSPRIFAEKVGPWYKKFSELLSGYGVDIISVDCDGMIDELIPTWLENGVNTMFPIEVGTWDASIAPWREKYGKNIRGVGGMNKTVFARDYKAIDEEIERLKALVDLGGYIPCPDHRIAPDAKWENVQYYCEKMRKEFNK
jgi:hypothetical protein